jgi:hypothetical protein
LIDVAVFYKSVRKDLVCVEELLGTVYKCLAVRCCRVDAGAVVEGLMGGTSRGGDISLAFSVRLCA